MTASLILWDIVFGVQDSIWYRIWVELKPGAILSGDMDKWGTYFEFLRGTEPVLMGRSWPILPAGAMGTGPIMLKSHSLMAWLWFFKTWAVLHPITLTWLCWQISASSDLSHLLITPLALVPPQNSSTLEAPVSQLHTNPWYSQNLVLHLNSGIINTTLNISV